MFQDELFQKQECSFVWNFLANLNEGLPRILGCQLRTIRALAMLDKILNFEYLFQDGVRQNLGKKENREINNAQRTADEPPSGS